MQVMRLAMREIKLLKASQHHNVVQLMEAFRSRSGRVYMVMVCAIWSPFSWLSCMPGTIMSRLAYCLATEFAELGVTQFP
eukprot:scaffold78612_cov17-Tisochrysis_lutea.AAC.1